MKTFSAFAILAGSHVLAAAPLAAQETARPAPAPAPEMTAAEAAGVQQAVDLGWRVYAYDQAAWHGTDAMLEDVPDARTRGIAGWIVNDIEGRWETVFYRPAKDGGFEAVWAGVYDGRKVIRRTTYAAGERALTAGEAELVQTTELLRSQKAERCGGSPFNTVVLPTGKPDGGFYAYLLTPQEKTGEIPFGGHHRFEIVGGEVKERRGFTKSCLTIPLANDKGKRPEALTVTHLLDATPTEIHVFSVYAAGLPVYVLTSGNNRVWSAELSRGKPLIRLIR
jgi:hypothetical protein